MRVLLSGSHGLVGSALSRSLKNSGHEVVALVRKSTGNASAIEWHPNQGEINTQELEGFDGVVHLAGESIASGRWTDEKKSAIRESRVKGTRLLSETLAQLSQPPAAFVCASAIGYYGDRGDELLTEESEAGDGFLAEVCVDWENAAKPALEKGIRTVNARFGVILDKDGGALGKMLTPFRMGIGGRVGDGKQWMSWIVLDDVVAGLLFALEKRNLSGPINFVAPNSVTNSEFTSALGRILSRPTFFPIPGFGARWAFGEMADALLLSSQRVTPRVLQASGFPFAALTIDQALRSVLLERG